MREEGEIPISMSRCGRCLRFIEKKCPNGNPPDAVVPPFFADKCPWFKDIQEVKTD